MFFLPNVIEHRLSSFGALPCMYVAIFLSIIAPAYTQITGLATLLVLVLRHHSSLKVQTKQTVQ